MNPLSMIMGLADLICIAIILLTFGFVWWTIILALIMIIKGVMSFF